MIIIGAGSAGLETSSILIKNNCKTEMHFFDTNVNLPQIINGIKVINNEIELKNQISLCPNFCVAIGNNRIRSNFFEKILKLGGIPSNIISVQTSIFDTFSENGTIIQPGVVISYGFAIGNSCMIHANSVIGHKVKIGNFVNIAPLTTIIGPINISDNVFIGSGCTVLPHINIGKNAFIEAGCIVDRDVQDFETIKRK